MNKSEKSSWIVLISLPLVAWLYFQSVIARSESWVTLISPSTSDILRYTILLIVLMVTLRIITAVFSSNDSGSLTDERDRKIEITTSHFSGLILGFLVITALLHFAFNPDYGGNLLFYSVLAGLIISQLSESLLTIVYYRRGI